MQDSTTSAFHDATHDVPGQDVPGQQRKRRQVLDAAAELFMAQGYGATSMDAVARAAGVSKATLYAYFSGKDALFAAIVGEACQRHAEGSTLCEGPGQADLAVALGAIGDGYLAFLFRDDVMAIYRVVMAEGHRFPELGHAFFESGPRRILTWLAGWMRERQAQGALPEGGDAQMMAEQFLALLRTSTFIRRMIGLPEKHSTEGHSAEGHSAEAHSTCGDEAARARVVAAAVTTFMAAFAQARGGA